MEDNRFNSIKLKNNQNPHCNLPSVKTWAELGIHISQFPPAFIYIFVIKNAFE